MKKEVSRSTMKLINTAAAMVGIFCGQAVSIVMGLSTQVGIAVSAGLVLLGWVVVYAWFETAALTQENIREKRNTFQTEDEYRKWLIKKLAEVREMINERKEKGLVEDPKLSEIKTFLTDMITSKSSGVWS